MLLLLSGSKLFWFKANLALEIIMIISRSLLSEHIEQYYDFNPTILVSDGEGLSSVRTEVTTKSAYS